jgi:hypothetical protein
MDSSWTFWCQQAATVNSLPFLTLQTKQWTLSWPLVDMRWEVDCIQESNKKETLAMKDRPSSSHCKERTTWNEVTPLYLVDSSWEGSFWTAEPWSNDDWGTLLAATWTCSPCDANKGTSAHKSERSCFLARQCPSTRMESYPRHYHTASVGDFIPSTLLSRLVTLGLVLVPLSRQSPPRKRIWKWRTYT